MTLRPLTGKDLLIKLYELSDDSLTDKARACGYDLGQGNDQFQQFLDAILTAQNNGVFLGSTTTNRHIQKVENGCVFVLSDGRINIESLFKQ